MCSADLIDGVVWLIGRGLLSSSFSLPAYLLDFVLS